MIGYKKRVLCQDHSCSTLETCGCFASSKIPSQSLQTRWAQQKPRFSWKVSQLFHFQLMVQFWISFEVQLPNLFIYFDIKNVCFLWSLVCWANIALYCIALSVSASDHRRIRTSDECTSALSPCVTSQECDNLPVLVSAQVAQLPWWRSKKVT